jgi:hypothetical protein
MHENQGEAGKTNRPPISDEIIFGIQDEQRAYDQGKGN